MKTDKSEEGRLWDKLMDNPALLEAMLEMPNEVNESMAKQRRNKLFSMLWELTTLEQKEVLNSVKEAESVLINEYGNDKIPNWLLRLEAQDRYLEMLHNEITEIGGD